MRSRGLSRPVCPESPWALLAGIVLLVGWPLSPCRGDSPAEQLTQGSLEFEHKNFGNAVSLLEPLLSPAILLSREEDIVKARELLGLSFFYNGEEAKAREQFVQLLYLRPRHRLDPFLIPPAAVHFFDQIWAEPSMKEKIEKIERERLEWQRQEAEKKAKPPRPATQKIYYERSEIHRSRLLAFLPLGVGQFHNDQNTKGALLATAGGLSLLSNIVCYQVLSFLANDNGKYAAEDVAVAKRLRVGQYVTLGLFLISWLYGVVDANLTFQPVTRSALQPSVGPGSGSAEPARSESPISLLPAIERDGASARFQWRF